MAQFVVQGPDGGKHVIEGPDNATPDQIEAFASQTLGPTDPKAAQTSAADQGGGRSFELRRSAPVPAPNPVADAADARVTKEAAAGLAPQPTFADAIPFKNDIMAGGEALLNKVTGGRFGSPYDEAYAYQQARDRFVQQNAPKQQLAMDVAGGLALARSFPAAKVLPGNALLAEYGNALLNMMGYGALFGAGDSSGEGRVANALHGAGQAAKYGTVAYPFLRAGGRVLENRAASNPPLPPELSSFDPRAVGTAAQLYREDNLGLPITGANAQANSLGQNAMLMDMGPNMRAVGTALAKRTGPEMNTIVKAISGRQQGAEARIDSAIDNAVGSPVNVPQMIDQMQTTKRAAAAPLYDQFHNTSIPMNPEIRAVLKRIPKSAFSEAQKLATSEGYQQQFRLRPVDEPMTPMTGVQGTSREQIPTGVEYDYLKRAVDDLWKGEKPGTNAERVYKGLSKDLRAAVDKTLNPSDPGASTWALARSVAGEHLKLQDAFDQGQKAFSKTLSADQMAYDMRNMSQEERAMYRIGARQQIRSVAENSGTKSGGNPDTATRSMLQTRNAQKKLALIAQRPSEARNLTRTLAAETKFDNTSMKALQNSDTALYMAAQKRVPGAIEADTQVHNLTMEGLVAAGAKKIIDSLASNAMSARNVRHAADLARILVAQGAPRDRIIAGIEKIIQGANVSPAQKAALQRGAMQALTVATAAASGQGQRAPVSAAR
jgi:hypothetical protein